MTAEMEAFDAEDDEFVDELKPGTELMLGQYTIERFLAAGGFGITYLAKDSLNRPVVIKECFPGGFCRRQNHSVMPRSRAHQNELKSIVRMFSQEAMSLSKAGHPNVVGVHQVFEENNTAYMALDYVEGSDLLTILNDNPESLKPELVEGYLLKVLDAIGHVHRQGILHRDISPDNIIVSTNGEPILIDFGAARANSEGTASRMLSALRVVKDGYSPQEFYLAGSEQGPSCDLYSLAASFYHIITDELPPDSQSRLTSFAENSPDPYVPLGKQTKAYSKAFCTALDKAISVLPRDRMQSADEWVQHMKNGKSNAAPAAVVSKEKTSEKTRSFMPILLGSTALVAVAGIGLSFVTGSDETTVASDTATEIASTPPTGAPEAAAETRAIDAPAVAAIEPPAAEIEPPVAETTALPAAEDTPATPVAPVPDAPEAEVAANQPVANDVEALTQAGPISGGFDAAAPDTTLPDVSTPGQLAELPRTTAQLVPTPEGAFVDALPETASQPPAPRPAINDSTADTAVVADAETAPVVAEFDADAMKRVIINSTWSVMLPFEASTDDMSTVGTVLFEGWGWLQEGTRIISVNGMEIPGIPAIQAMLRQTTLLEDEAQLEIMVGTGKNAQGELIEHQLIMPVVQYIALGDGTQIEVASRQGEWQTVATKVPESDTNGLQSGDVIVDYLNTGVAMDGRTSFVDALQADRRAGVTSFPLRVLRDGVLIETSFELYPMNKPRVETPVADVPAPVADPAPAVVADAVPTITEQPVEREPVVESTAPAQAEASLSIQDAASVFERQAAAMPFVLSSAEPTTVGQVNNGAPTWLVPGLKIISVNDTPVVSNTDIIDAFNAAVAESRGADVDVRIGIDARLLDAAIERVVTVSSTIETVLLNGFSFATRRENGVVSTTVANVPDGSNFKIGDKVVAYLSTGERINDTITLKDLLDRELADGKTSFSFALEREGEMWVETFNLAALQP